MLLFVFFFFNDTPTPEIYTLFLHDALPIYFVSRSRRLPVPRSVYYVGAIARCDRWTRAARDLTSRRDRDRKSTRLNSSHTVISYAVFCLKKKKTFQYETRTADMWKSTCLAR